MRHNVNSLVFIFTFFYLCSCSTEADVVNYIDCDWVIPTGFDRVNNEGFTKLDTDFNFSSIYFRHDDDPEEKSISRLLEDPMFIAAHEKFDVESGMKVNQMFLHRHGSDSYTISLFIKKNGYVVSIVGLSYDDFSTLTKYCFEPSTLSGFYSAFEQWKLNVKAQNQRKMGRS